MGTIETTNINANSENQARNKFYEIRPLSDILEIREN